MAKSKTLTANRSMPVAKVPPNELSKMRLGSLPTSVEATLQVLEAANGSHSTLGVSMPLGESWGKLVLPEPSTIACAQASSASASGESKKKVRKSFTKIPKASELSPQVVARASKKERAQRDAPIQVQIRKYTDDASIFVHAFPTEPMWQVQVVHEAVPSVTFDI
eukprot:363898-Lingulodinium_polyedra.AAC.1